MDELHGARLLAAPRCKKIDAGWNVVLHQHERTAKLSQRVEVLYKRPVAIGSVWVPGQMRCALQKRR